MSDAKKPLADRSVLKNAALRQPGDKRDFEVSAMILELEAKYEVKRADAVLAWNWIHVPMGQGGF